MASAFLQVERRWLVSDMTRAYLWSMLQMDQSKLHLNCYLIICFFIIYDVFLYYLPFWDKNVEVIDLMPSYASNLIQVLYRL